MERPIRLPARTYYDTLENYIYKINEFDYSKPSFESFKAILNSDIEPQHEEQCILWYNSFDQTLHDREAEWDVPPRYSSEREFLEDTDIRDARIADEKYRKETHAINRGLWEKGNPPPPRNEKERTERHMTALKADPEKYAHYVRGNEKPKYTKRRKFSLWPFGGKTRKN